MPTNKKRSSGGAKRSNAGVVRGANNGHRSRPPVARASRKSHPSRNGATMSAEALFPGLSTDRHRFGLGVIFAILERQGDDVEMGIARVGRFFPKPGQRPKSAILGAADAGQVARMLAGLAHPDRIRILRAMLQGAATHHALHEAVGLKTGPLYHHLRALERAGVLTMATRNAYEMTERGRVALLVTHTLGAVFTSQRKNWSKRRLICRRGK